MTLRQASAIPFRRAHTEPASFCLITTSSGRRWGFPKGVIEHGDTPQQTALKESLEEAGLRGRIVGEPVGSFTQTKWRQTFTVAVYLMEVTGVDDVWEEQVLRRRRWCDGPEALTLLRGRRVEPVFQEALEVVSTLSP